MEEDADEGQRSGEPTLFNSETATAAWGQAAHRTSEIYDAARVGRNHCSSNMTAFTLHCFPNNRTSTANRVGNSPAYTVAGYFLKTELSIRLSFFYLLKCAYYKCFYCYVLVFMPQTVFYYGRKGLEQGYQT